MHNAGINYLAVFTAAAAAWVFSAIWYYSFASRWADALGTTKEGLMPAGRQPIGTIIISLFAQISMAIVLAHFVSMAGIVSVMNGLMTAAACWVGFILTTIIVNDRYTRGGFAIISIASWHWLGVILIMGAVIGAFGP